ncbi:uncharacterized protein [Miscanthus floridulus]|uniref:uncharacterized protein n=1 Tax=Miscanthus floridulus TaxID=154761 RepID=UPI00345A944A
MGADRGEGEGGVGLLQVEKRKEGATSAPLEKKMEAGRGLRADVGEEEGGRDLCCPPLELGVNLGGGYPWISAGAVGGARSALICPDAGPLHLDTGGLHLGAAHRRNEQH